MSQNPPKVSVGLPVYNSERYLPATLDSLLAQTFSDFELIVSDDGSTDGTVEICQRYMAKDSRIRCFFRSTNVGMSANQNYVLHQARGEYFMWAAHDDWWDRDFIRTLLQAMESNPMCTSAFCPHVFTDESGRPTSPILRWDYTSRHTLLRLLKLCIHYNDAFFYGLHRKHVLIRTRVPTWWGVNARTPVNSNYPVLFCLLSAGEYALAGSLPLWFKRRKPPSYTTVISKNRLSNLFASLLRKVNVLCESARNVYLGSSSFLLVLVILPVLVARCGLDCFRLVMRPIKKRIGKLG